MTSLSAGQIRLLQTNLNERLRARGRAPVTVDGKYGPQTRKAVHLVKYLLGFPMASLDTGPSDWFRTVVAHPARRPAAYLARAAARRAYAAKHAVVASLRGTLGLDWAWGTPPIAALKALRVRFACRYLSHDASKNLTRAEADRLRAAGIPVVVVWETTANRATAGRAAGRADAVAALAQLKACGLNIDDGAIHFAVDFAATGAQVRPYFEGVRQVLSYSDSGVYGSDDVCDALADLVKYRWQTYAWSGGRVSPKATLYQFSNGHLVGGVSCDFNRALADDFGQFS